MTILSNKLEFAGIVNVSGSVPSLAVPLFKRANSASYFIQEIDFENDKIIALIPVDLSLYELKTLNNQIEIFPDAKPIVAFVKSKSEVLIGTKDELKEKVSALVKTEQLDSALCMQIGKIFCWPDLFEQAQMNFIAMLMAEGGQDVARTFINSEVRSHAWRYLALRCNTEKQRKRLRLDMGKVDVFFNENDKLVFCNFSNALKFDDEIISELKKEIITEFSAAINLLHEIKEENDWRRDTEQKREVRQSKRKGILLCGGSGVRLSPLTVEVPT